MTDEITMPNGRHKGERITRIPVSYLKWIANTPDHSLCQSAKTEMDRRGTVTPDVDVSGHAIDRASLRCRKLWHEDRGKDEGIYSWLCRITREALDKQKMGGWEADFQCEHKGMKLTITREGTWPVLKSIWPSKKKNREEAVAAINGGGVPVRTAGHDIYVPQDYGFTPEEMEWDAEGK